MDILNSYLSRYPGAEITIVGPQLLTQPTFHEPVIFVDGGSQWRINSVGVSVGDGDSHKLPLDIILPTEKDISDLGHLLQVLPTTVSKLKLLGFSGGRLDHQIANLGELHRFLLKRTGGTQLSLDETLYGYGSGQWILHHHGVFSLFTLVSQKINLTGDCKYQFKNSERLEPLSSHGLSNVAHGRIQITNESPVFVITNKASALDAIF